MVVRRLLLDAAAEISAPEPAGGVSEDFDTGMVIILAALLCALIGALGMNSIVRCAMRCGGGTEEAAVGGMKGRELRRIPVAEYGEGAGISGAEECAICLADFAEGERVRVMPRCGHVFHVACIDRWLLSRSSCPNCRHSLLENKPTGGGRRPESESGGGLVAVEVEAARV